MSARVADRIIDERRTYPRAPLRAFCEFEVEHKLYAGVLHDVSAGGAFLETDVPLPCGREVELSLRDPALWLRGRFVRTVEGRGGGLEIVSAPEEFFAVLFALVP